MHWRQVLNTLRNHSECSRGAGTVALALALGVAAPVAAQNPPPNNTQGGKTDVLPTVTVSGTTLDEERRVGANKQPEWTTERRFPTSRVYVLPPGMIEFESWWRGTYNRDGAKADRFLDEVEFGLPGRWQIDLYGRFEGETGKSTRYVGEQIETRYAFAEWGKLPGNPTAYLEFKHNQDGPHVLEGKLLFGDEWCHGWHWAVNLSYEEEMGGSREIERAVTFAVSKTIKDSKFSVGIETEYDHVSAHGSRSQDAFLIGPSFQWRPSRNTHLDFVPLVGTTHDSPDVQIYVVFGVNLRQGGKGKTVEIPVSAGSR